MGNLYKIGIRIGLLLLILIVSNGIYSKYFYEKDLHKYSPIIEKIRSIDPQTRILYFEEDAKKVNLNSDFDKRTVSELLQSFYPDLKVSEISLNRLHSGLILPLLHKIEAHSHIETIIVPIQLGSFSHEWMLSNQELEYKRQIKLINPYPPLVNRILYSINPQRELTTVEKRNYLQKEWKKDAFKSNIDLEYENIYEWDRGMLLKGVLNEDGEYENEKTALATKYIKSFAGAIDISSNRQIKDMNKLIKYVDKKGWNLIFLLYPENGFECTKLVGDTLTELMMKNIRILEDFAEDRKFHLITPNMYEDDFVEARGVQAAYREFGRKKIALEIAVHLRPIFKELYDYEEEEALFPASFFHDCESDYDGWVQDHALFEGTAYSGHFSSKIYDEHPFSVTFEYNLKNLLGMEPDSVTVDFMVKNGYEDQRAKLVVELVNPGDNGVEMQWIGVDLSEHMVNEGEDWSKISSSYNIEKNVQMGSGIKIYVLNENSLPVYIDDLSIRFH